MAKFRVIGGIHVQDGRVYEKDAVVETTHDLCGMFKGKFELVDNSVPATHSRPPVPTKAFVEPAATAVAKAVQTAAEKGASEIKPATPAGTDVTARFPKAVEQDFKVFKRQGQFYVYDADAMSKPLNEAGVNKDGVDAVIEAAL